jgi:hypothetical protein
MTTIRTAYPDEASARRTVEILRHRGVPARDILLLVGSPLRDVRREPVGGFAGPVGPDDTVGTYGGGTRLRGQGTGAFAGDPDAQRQGSFADTDRVVTVSYEGETERMRVTGHPGRRRLPREAALDGEAIERALAELHAGHAVVVTKTADITAQAAGAAADITVVRDKRAA